MEQPRQGLIPEVVEERKDEQVESGPKEPSGVHNNPSIERNNCIFQNENLKQVCEQSNFQDSYVQQEIAEAKDYPLEPCDFIGQYSISAFQENYSTDDLLGEGTYGNVYKGV